LPDFKSLCKGPIWETVQDSYNSGPYKNRMSSSSSGCIHQFRHVTKACVSLNWHQRRENWSSACCRSRPAMKVCSSATTVKFPLKKCGKCCDAFALDPLPTFTQRDLVDVTPTVRHIQVSARLRSTDRPVQ